MKRLLFCVVASTLLAGCSGDKAPPPEPTKESFYEATKSISEDLTVDDKQAFEKCCETINTRGKELLIGFKAGPEPARVVAVEGGHSIEVSIRDQLESSYTFMTPEQIEHRQESQILQTMLYAAYLCDDVLSFNRKRSLKWVRISVYSPVKDGTGEKLLLARKLKATPADAKKISGWLTWPNFRPEGYAGSDKDRLLKDMWTVEFDDYAKFQMKKK